LVLSSTRRHALIILCLTSNYRCCSSRCPPPRCQIAFAVELRGRGLLGPPTFALRPHEQRTYELVYAPLFPTKGTAQRARIDATTEVTYEEEGALCFSNEDAGEFWYRLLLTCTPAPPIEVPPMHCELGLTAAAKVTVENPTGLARGGSSTLPVVRQIGWCARAAG